MQHPNVKLDFRREAQRIGTAYVLGTLVWRQPGEHGRSAAEAIDASDTRSELASTLRQTTGFFALATELNDTIAVATDQISGISLYYTVIDGGYYVTDDQRRLRSIVDLRTLDTLSEKEFFHAGIVTGGNTRYDAVSQVPAGVIVEFSEPVPTTERYFTFEYRGSNRVKEASLADVVQTIVDRLIQFADGRPIIVPLSGGLDSRLLLTSLVDLGYEDLKSFTSGTSDNPDYMLGRQVAESLGVEHRDYEVTHEVWNRWFKSKKRRIAENLFSMVTVPPITNAWLALEYFLDTGWIPPNAVVVPGHSADFLAGSHIPRLVHQKKWDGAENVIESIYQKYFCFNHPTSRPGPILRNRLLEVASPRDDSVQSVVEAFERWDWLCRQTNQITIQTEWLEWLGVDWWLPYWDADFFDFWLGVPFEQRYEKVIFDLHYGRSFYDAYVTSYYDCLALEPVNRTTTSKPSAATLIKDRISRSFLGPYLRPLHHVLFDTDPRTDRLDPTKIYRQRPKLGIFGENEFGRRFDGETSSRAYWARLLAESKDG